MMILTKTFILIFYSFNTIAKYSYNNLVIIDEYLFRLTFALSYHILFTKYITLLFRFQIQGLTTASKQNNGFMKE
jgi:hypothetical protein